MKLTKKQVKAIEKKTGFTPLPDEAAAESGLAEAFGDQTFYVDPDGVYVFEAVEQLSGTGEPVTAIQIAEVERSEEDSDEVTVRAVQPRTASLTVDLAA